MHLHDWLRLVALSVIWGSSFLFTEIALVDLEPLTVVNLRMLFAALTLLALWRLQRLPGVRGAHLWRAFALIAVTNNILPFTLIVWAQTHISASLAAILNAAVPLFGVVLAWLFTQDERPGLAKFVGVVIGFVGVIVLIAPTGEELAAATLAGQIAVLTATFCYAVSSIYSKRFKDWGVPPVITATMQALLGAILLLPLTLVLEQPWQAQLSTLWTPVAVVCLGVICSALAYLLFFRILANAGAVNLMLVALLIPVSACLLAAIFLGERLAGGDLLGMLIIFAGLLIIDGRLVPKLRTLLS